MKLHELAPQQARLHRLGVRVEVQAPVTARLPAKVTKVRTLVPAVA